MARIRMILVAAVGVLIMLGGLFFMARSSSGSDRTQFVAEFDNVIGLANNSQVLYRGVKIGEVTSIDLKEGTGGSVALVKVSIDEGSSVEVTADASLVLRLKSILGELFLDLDPGSSPKPLDRSVALTKTHRDTSLDQILFQGAALYGDVKAAEQTKSVVDQAKALIESSDGDITAITDNSRQIVEGLTSRVGAVNNIITNLDILTASTEGRSAELGVAIDEVNRNLARVRDTLARNNDRIKNLLETINGIAVTTDLTRLDEQLAKAPEYIDKLDHGLLLLRAVMHHKIPIWATTPTLQGMTPADFLGNLEKLRKENPFLAGIMAGVLELYLGAG